MRGLSNSAIKTLYKHVLDHSGSPGVELSEAEYAALSEDEKHNGNVYYVYDDNPEEDKGVNPYVIEITQDAYDSLPESAKNNGKLYCVKTDDSDSGGVNPYVIEITQDAYDSLPESKKNNGRMYFIKDHTFTSTLRITDIIDDIVPKGEINSDDLPSTATEHDFYYLLDRGIGIYYINGEWKPVR